MIPISYLPYFLLRWLSSIFFIFLFFIFSYRKKIVVANISASFPSKSKQEINEISKQFYKHFCDVLLESFKTFTISKKQLHKHLICKNPEILNKYYEEGKNVIITIGHYNSWEFLLTGFNTFIKHNAAVLYQPLSNSYFDEKTYRTRSAFGTKMIPVSKAGEYFKTQQPSLTATVFAIDQSPSNPNRAYWTRFLNQDTGVLFGAEKYAKEYNYPVVYVRINKIKRSYYSFEFVDMFPDPSGTQYGEITQGITKQLETDIIKKPEFWLWSHRRWKHKRPTDN
jgi:KDO2-lipid IV(A) lauroyltransferase